MTTPHLPADDLLSAYLDGELTVVERAEVERALAASAEYRQKLAELEALRGTLKSLPTLKLDGGFQARVLQAIAAAQVKEAKHADAPKKAPTPVVAPEKSSWQAPFVGILAAGALAASLAFILAAPWRSPPIDDVAIAPATPAAHVATQDEAKKHLEVNALAKADSEEAAANLVVDEAAKRQAERKANADATTLVPALQPAKPQSPPHDANGSDLARSADTYQTEADRRNAKRMQAIAGRETRQPNEFAPGAPQLPAPLPAAPPRPEASAPAAIPQGAAPSVAPPRAVAGAPGPPQLSFRSDPALNQAKDSAWLEITAETTPADYKAAELTDSLQAARIEVAADDVLRQRDALVEKFAEAHKKEVATELREQAQRLRAAAADVKTKAAAPALDEIYLEGPADQIAAALAAWQARSQGRIALRSGTEALQRQVELAAKGPALGDAQAGGQPLLAEAKPAASLPAEPQFDPAAPKPGERPAPAGPLAAPGPAFGGGAPRAPLATAPAKNRRALAMRRGQESAEAESVDKQLADSGGAGATRGGAEGGEFKLAPGAAPAATVADPSLPAGWVRVRLIVRAKMYCGSNNSDLP